jgi:hypothetical protein
MKALSGIAALRSIEMAISRTAKPYADIYKAAEKKGLVVSKREDGDTIVFIAKDQESGFFAKSCVVKGEPDAALFNEFSFPKGA